MQNIIYTFTLIYFYKIVPHALLFFSLSRPLSPSIYPFPFHAMLLAGCRRLDAFDEGVDDGVPVDELGGGDQVVAVRGVLQRQVAEGGDLRERDPSNKIHEGDRRGTGRDDDSRGERLRFLERGARQPAQELFVRTPPALHCLLHQAHRERRVPGVHVRDVVRVGLVEVFDDEVQGLAEEGEDLFALLFPEQAELFQVVEGEEVLETVRLQDLALEELQLLGLQPGVGEAEEGEQAQDLDEGLLLVDAFFQVLYALLEFGTSQ